MKKIKRKELTKTGQASVTAKAMTDTLKVFNSDRQCLGCTN